MADNLFLDKDTVYAFQELYPGDIEECVDDLHISFGAFADQKAASFVLISIAEDGPFVDWIYTIPEMRNQGIGSELLRFAVKCAESGLGPNELNVLCPDFKTMLFFENNGFLCSGSMGTSYTGVFKDMKEIHQGVNKSESVALRELSDTNLNLINNELYNAEEAAYCVKLPVRPEDYSEFSRACIIDNKLAAIILLKQNSDDVMDIAYVYKATGKDIALMKMLSEVKAEVTEKVSADLKVRAVTLNESSEKLFKNMFSNADSDRVYLVRKLLF